MLKLLLISVLVVGSLAAPSKNDEKYHAALHKEFRDFIAELPMQALLATFLDHSMNDEEMQAAIKYIQGREFQHDVHALSSKPSAKEFVMRYKDAGLDIQKYQALFFKFLSMMSFPDENPDATKSFGKLLADMSDQIPYDRLLELLAEKLENSPVFIRFWNAITDQEIHLLANKAMKTREFKHFAQDLEDMDVPFYKLQQIVFSVFGWQNAKGSPNDL